MSILKTRNAMIVSPHPRTQGSSYHESVYDRMIEALKAEGRYLCSTEEREKLREMMWPDGRHLNRDVVAKPVLRLAEMANLNVPEDTRFLMVLGEKPGPEDRFSGEKICLVLTVWKWTDFDEIVRRVGKMLQFSGEGHSVSLHSENRDRQIQLALRSNVGRVNCNMSHAMANSGSWSGGHPFFDHALTDGEVLNLFHGAGPENLDRPAVRAARVLIDDANPGNISVAHQSKGFNVNFQRLNFGDHELYSSDSRLKQTDGMIMANSSKNDDRCNRSRSS